MCTFGKGLWGGGGGGVGERGESARKYYVKKSCTLHVSPGVRESKTDLDSGFHTVDSRFQVRVPGTLSVELGFWIPIVSGILDSLCIYN